MKTICSCLLVYLVGISPEMLAQNPTPGAPPPQKYKLSILEDASTVKRVKGGRVSSQVVVKVTDENDRPMPAIAVIFTIPQMNGGGAAFANGSLMSSVVTDSTGAASSGSFTAGPTSAFNMSVTASTPSGPVTATVPVNIQAALAASGAAAAGAGAGAAASHTGLIIGIVAGVAAAGAVAAKVATGGKNNNPAPAPASVSGTIGGSSTPVFGPH